MRVRLLIVSAAMLAFAASPLVGNSQPQTQGKALSFGLTSMNGKRMFISDLVKDGPVFLYFIRPGDSINNDFAKRLHQIIKTYSPGEAKWYGVITGDKSRADAWSAEFAPPYDVLRDENLSVIQLYGIESSPAVIRIGTEGQVLGEWAGFSGYRLKQINAAVAGANQAKHTYIDFNDTPSMTRYGQKLIMTRKG